MEPITIRQFRPQDLEPAIRIMRESFSDEMVAMGVTVDDFERQMRNTLRLRMIPFRALTALSRIRWEFWVAEWESKVVGFGMFVGRKHLELSSLMVAPEYRRRGIGQALLIKRMQRIKRLGFSLATVSVLTTNQASRGNLAKQGFREIEHYSLYRHTLPLATLPATGSKPLCVRQLRRSDKAAVAALERQSIAPQLRDVRDSMLTRYFPSPAYRMLNKLGKLRRNNLGLELNGALIACISAHSEINEHIGSVARPLIDNRHAVYFPVLLAEAASWLAAQGKTAINLTIPNDRTDLVDQLVADGWYKVLTWIDLIKRLD